MVDPARCIVSVTLPAAKPLILSTFCANVRPLVATPSTCKIWSPSRRPAISAGEPARTLTIRRAPVAGSVARAAPMPPVKRFLANAARLVIAECMVSLRDSWLDRRAERVPAVQRAISRTPMKAKIPLLEALGSWPNAKAQARRATEAGSHQRGNPPSPEATWLGWRFATPT